ncbi:MAG: hypothetical protein ABS81_05065 [Pseudonocardia sp. SCN 72-86]|nr:MAG: hypothetical protein ABS81_05065 [Pseudonocardia sp. SCN 72-86]
MILAIAGALFLVTGCGNGTIDQAHTVLGCDMSTSPGNAAPSDQHAQVMCVDRQIAARACHVSTSDVDELLSRTTAGNSALLHGVGHGGRVVATLQTPFNGGELIVSCPGTGQPTRALDKDLLQQLSEPGDPTDLPDWLRAAA